MVTTKLISWKTMLEALNTVHHSLRNGSRALTNEFRAIWCDGPCNNDVEFMTLYAMAQLGIISKSPVGTKVISTWMSTEIPSDAMAHMVFNYVFGPDTDKAVQHNMDVTEHYKQKKSKYMKYYKVFTPPADDAGLVTKKSRSRDPEIVKRYVDMLTELYVKINDADFVFAKFMQKHKVSSYATQAINKLNIIDTNYKGRGWVYPEMPSEKLAIDILDNAATLQRNYLTNRENRTSHKHVTTVVKHGELKAAVSVTQNKEVNKLKPGSVAHRVMTAITQNGLTTDITFASVKSHLSDMPQSKMAQVHMAMAHLSISGRLVKTGKAVYALPNVGNVHIAASVADDKSGVLQKMIAHRDKLTLEADKMRDILKATDTEIATLNADIQLMQKKNELVEQLEKIKNTESKYVNA